jgi:uridine kinase
MKPAEQRKLIAIVGGSGSGKSWLADRLQRAFGPGAARLSLDNFYLDRAHLPPWQRGRINFDHPRAIDWRRFEAVLRESRVQREVSIPQYNFATHTRLPHDRPWTPAPLILVDGLWLLGRARVRRLFDFRIYLDCPGQLRLERRLSRDVTERGRTADSVRDQFWKMVAPMHERYVATQLRLADLVLQQPSGEVEIHELVAALHAMVPALRQVEEDTPPLSRPADGHKGRSCSKPARTGGLAAGPSEPAFAGRWPMPLATESLVAHSLLL